MEVDDIYGLELGIEGVEVRIGRDFSMEEVLGLRWTLKGVEGRQV